MLINLIIADTNHEYMKRLREYIEDKYKGEYDIELIDDKDKLQTRVEKNRCDILLITSSVYSSDINFRNADLSVLLMDGELEESYNNRFKRKVNKYTRISKLMEYLNCEYKERKNYRPLMYTIYSPAGGVGKTTIALATALQYVKMGRQVLYINLEDIDSTPIYFSEKDQSLDDELTKALENTSQKSLLDQAMKDKLTGIKYFKRDKTLDICSLESQEIIHKIQSSIDSELVNVIIVDTNSNISTLNKKILELSNYIFMIVDENKESIYKVNNLIESKYIDNNLQQKMRLVTNFCQTYNINKIIKNIGSIDKIEDNTALNVCKYIAKSNLLNLHALSED